MIVYEAVSSTYGAVVAVRDVSLSIRTGATTALIGPSGCGKSTLLKLALGLVPTSHGSIQIGSESLASADLEAWRQRVGYVIQSGGLFPHLVAADNVILLARHLRWAPDAMAARVRELADLVRLPHSLLARWPHELSGGQRQRVSLMRALFLDPPLLLLDEPMGALDPMVRHDLQGDLRILFARLKKTVVLVTHDLKEATFLAEHIVLMQEGRLVQQGGHADLVENPANAFVRAFLEAQGSRHD